jgi:hypothetical protein
MCSHKIVADWAGSAYSWQHSDPDRSCHLSEMQACTSTSFEAGREGKNLRPALDIDPHLPAPVSSSTAISPQAHGIKPAAHVPAAVAISIKLKKIEKSPTGATGGRAGRPPQHFS